MQLITKPEVEESGVNPLLEKSGIFPSLPAQDHKKTKDVEQHYSQGQENNSLIPYSKQKSNIFCRCELPEVDSHRYLFSQLINDSLLLKDLTHMKRLQLLKAWSKNPDQVRSLNNDLIHLSFAEIWGPGNHPCYCTKDEIEKINIKSKSLTHLLEKSKQKIYLLIDFRLLELGALHSSSNNQRMLASFASKEYRGEKVPEWITRFPKDMVDEILKRSWENFGCSILDDIKKLTINYKFITEHLESVNEPQFSPAGRFFLRTLDFLNRQKLISKQTLLVYLNDSEFERQVIYCTHASYNSEVSSSHMKKIWYGIESVTKHWYWSMMLEEYTVLNEMDERFLTLNYLSGKLLKFGNQYIKIRSPLEDGVKTICSLSIQEYVDNLKLIIISNESHPMSDERGLITINSSFDLRDQLKEQIRRLINLLQILFHIDVIYIKGLTSSEEHLSISICQILDFTPQKISGIVEETEEETMSNDSLKEFRAKKQITLSYAWAYGSYEMIQSFKFYFLQVLNQNYVKRNAAYISRISKSLKKELNTKTSQFNNDYYVMKKEPLLSVWMKHHHNINNFKEDIERGCVDKELKELF
ncbi:hypothetical protein PGT21_036447 [Puccinia graminis f. sp. tritici]|uniref:Uncharacterized protein n=1 Tax=Puccinia graminis f. sp. tritici TaxID=56615 RepID=A0A5B0Q0T0_PUCGR|nr:hypothetical protein PGT21_036447 [Puccinia graminis f. sp. tritici]